MLGTILLVILILMVLGALPQAGLYKGGYGPSGGLGLLVLILLILFLFGHRF